MDKKPKNFLPWTGLFPYTDSDGKTERGKTLWDWLSLLIVPVLIGGGLTVFNQISHDNEVIAADQKAQVDRDIALDASRETTLQNYLDRMNDLVLSDNLGQDGAKPGAAAVAKTLTFTTMRRIDVERRAIVLRFIYDAQLVSKDHAVILLNGTDLKDANLSGAVLSFANLSGVDLSGGKTDLSDADLSSTNLYRTNLSGAKLTNTNLSGANLFRADLSGADLSGANLLGANTFHTAMSKLTKFDENTILPDGKQWSSDTDLTQYDIVFSETP